MLIYLVSSILFLSFSFKNHGIEFRRRHNIVVSFTGAGITANVKKLESSALYYTFCFKLLLFKALTGCFKPLKGFFSAVVTV